MSSTYDILNNAEHRGWPIPKEKWVYYQEWNDVLFLHWKVSIDELFNLVPGNFKIDTYNGEAWVSLVAFTMNNVRPRLLPSVSFISNFDEVNVRTYIIKDGKPGVFFLSLEAGKGIAALLARKLSGLAYCKSKISRRKANMNEYTSENVVKDFRVNVKYSVDDDITGKSNLDEWLTERYCVYFEKEGKGFIYEVNHLSWELHQVKIEKAEISYRFGDLIINRPPDLAQFSKGVKVVSWKKQCVY